jgi:O-antigen/teichoic acid export membrane protein
MLLADFGTRFVLGNKYEGSALILKILIWATVPMFLNNALNTFLLARNEEKLLVRTAFVCMLVNIGANLLLIPRFSYVGAAAVTILTELVLLGQNVKLVKKALGFLPLPPNMFTTSAIFILVLVAALFLTRWWPSVVVAIVAAAVFGLATYFGGAVHFSRLTERAAPSI